MLRKGRLRGVLGRGGLGGENGEWVDWGWVLRRGRLRGVLGRGGLRGVLGRVLLQCR